jgi:hypothetical protein
MCFGKDVDALQRQLQQLLQNGIKPVVSVPSGILLRYQRETLANRLMDHIKEMQAGR